MNWKIRVHRVNEKDLAFVDNDQGQLEMLMEYCPSCRKRTPVWIRRQDDLVGQNLKSALTSSFLFGSRQSKAEPGSNWYCANCQYHHPKK